MKLSLNLVVLMGGVLPLLGLLIYGCGGQTSSATAQAIETNYFEIETPRGRMVIRLYDETPGHRDNFKKLVAEQFFDSTLFHRVISAFMIQGGDPNSRDDNLRDDGLGGPGYTVPAEIRPGLFHKRGALSAARQGDQANPSRASSGSQFYIVQGMIYPDEFLAQLENQLKQMIPDTTFAFSEEMRRVYTTEGGAPNLDGMYTVFGELVEGFDVLDRIARLATSTRVGLRTMPPDRPLEPLWMVIRPLPDYEE